MGFDDLFESIHKQNSKYRDDTYGPSYNSRRSYHGSGEHINLVSVLQKIRYNRKLKLFILLAAIAIVVIAIALIIVLGPLIVKLFNYIGQQGMLDNIINFLDEIWKGTGN